MMELFIKNHLLKTEKGFFSSLILNHNFLLSYFRFLTFGQVAISGLAPLYTAHTHNTHNSHQLTSRHRKQRMENWFYSISPDEKEMRKEEVRMMMMMRGNSLNILCLGEETVQGCRQE